jgi:hypothetical protein
LHVGSSEPKALSNTFQLSGDIEKLSGKASVTAWRWKERAYPYVDFQKYLPWAVEGTTPRIGVPLSSISHQQRIEKSKDLALYDATNMC